MSSDTSFPGNGRYVTYRQLLTYVGAVAGAGATTGFAVFGFLIARIDGAAEGARTLATQALQTHEAHPHAGAVSRAEFQLLREDIRELKEQVRANREILLKIRGGSQ